MYGRTTLKLPFPLIAVVLLAATVRASPQQLERLLLRTPAPAG